MSMNAIMAFSTDRQKRRGIICALPASSRVVNVRGGAFSAYLALGVHVEVFASLAAV
jgi:hypothetical protein